MTAQDSLPAADSPLRAARKRLAMTLEEVAKEITALDPRPDPPAVTASELSAWERGLRTTSPRYRRLLCQFYGQPAEVLFAHQDSVPELHLVGGAAGSLVTPAKVVHGVKELRAAMCQVVQTAEQHLAVCGSRSRDPDYLAAIEHALAGQPSLIHWRVLCGPPRRRLLTEHLLRLLELRDPADRTVGVQTLNIGLVDLGEEPERGLVASEQRALVTIPSLSGDARNFDTAIVLEHPLQASRLVEHTRQLYAAATKLETPEAIRALPEPSR